MKLNVGVVAASITTQRLRKLKNELGYISAADFFRTIPLAQEKEEVQQYMESASPKGELSETKQWLIEKGFRIRSPQFSKSWRINRVTKGNRVVWEITNILASGTAKSQIKFLSIEFGSKTSTWIADRSLRFKNGKWFGIEEGQEVTHWGNKPADVIKKTSEFIETELLPQIRAKLNETIERRLDLV